MPAENVTKVNPVWFKGIDDELYAKVNLWKLMYWNGEVHSTRKWMSPEGVIDKPVKMIHYVPFREVELDHLVRILEAARPNTPLVEEIRKLRQTWRTGKPLSYIPYAKSYWAKAKLPSGIHRVIALAFYPELVQELLSILDEVKIGQVIQPRPDGKDLFEQ